MGLMGYLRSRAGLVIFVIGLAIVAFLLGDVINYGTPFWMKNQNQVGSVNGEGLDHQDFNAQVDQAVANLQQQMGGGTASPQMRNYAVQQAWNQFISEQLLNQEIEKIGITIGKDEFNELIFGNNPSMYIVQQFTNPETGQFSKEQVAMVSREAKSNAQLAGQWEALLENIRSQRLNEKYSNLVSNSLYTTALEAEYEHTSRNKIANFKYVMLDYTLIKDSEVKPTDADYKEYYDKHKNTFKNQEASRAVEYVVFDARPTAADTLGVLNDINKAKNDLQASSSEEQLVTSVSETKYPVRYYTKNQLGGALDTVLFSVATGSVVGPYLSGSTYQVAKVLDAKFSPDSVEASHILLNPVAEGGLEKAKLKADSIKSLIQKGDNFAALAVEFSQDGSKNNGGSLGTFARGAMVPEFEEPAFNGKVGDVVIAESKFGLHIIKIERQVGNSKIVKAAIIDKSIASGKETRDAAYNKANTFLSAINQNNFEEEAKKQGLTVLSSAKTGTMDNALNSTEVPRELIRWAFEAKKGEVADKIYESEDHYVVAKLIGVQEKGLLPLDAVKSDIELSVKNFVKSRMLKEKLNNAVNGSTSIEQIGQKVGKNVQTVENIVLANPIIPGVAQENAVIGTVFGLQPNKPSKAIEGAQGVYAVQVIGFVNPTALTADELSAKQKQLSATTMQRAWGGIFRALQDKATIDDNRIRFY